ncbi:MAG: four-helix bundle copper-binding protein [Burkholderiaceae bacterium]
MTPTDLQRCLQACYACADACDTCAIACLNEADPAPMSRCVALDVDCAQICRMAAGFMARSSEFDAAVCELCARVCEACAVECEHHTMDHCQACADACRRCALACCETVAARAADTAQGAHTHPRSAGASPSISVG